MTWSHTIVNVFSTSSVHVHVQGLKGETGDPGFPGPPGRNGTDGLPGVDVRMYVCQLSSNSCVVMGLYELDLACIHVYTR